MWNAGYNEVRANKLGKEGNGDKRCSYCYSLPGLDISHWIPHCGIEIYIFNEVLGKKKKKTENNTFSPNSAQPRRRHCSLLSLNERCSIEKNCMNIQTLHSRQKLMEISLDGSTRNEVLIFLKKFIYYTYSEELKYSNIELVYFWMLYAVGWVASQLVDR